MGIESLYFAMGHAPCRLPPVKYVGGAGSSSGPSVVYGYGVWVRGICLDTLHLPRRRVLKKSMLSLLSPRLLP